MDLVTLFVSHSIDRTQICELGPVNCRESATWRKPLDGLPLSDSTSIIKYVSSIWPELLAATLLHLAFGVQ